LGSALLVPIVPAAVAGAGLAAFSGGLLSLYAKTPGMRREHSPFPTQQGTDLAKDAWMTGIGLSLLIDDLTDRPPQAIGSPRFPCRQRRDLASGHLPYRSAARWQPVPDPPALSRICMEGSRPVKCLS
jgi:hypothetical protein